MAAQIDNEAPRRRATLALCRAILTVRLATLTGGAAFAVRRTN
jgi:hypothetical protein